MKQLFKIIFVFLFLTNNFYTQENKGGMYITSEGNLNALFLFIQFPDDHYEADNLLWPLNKPPDYINNFVENSNEKISHNGNLSCYFDDMSCGKFRLTGKTIFMITPHSREWYLQNKMTRADINREVIQKADSTVDFSPFDNWTYIKPFRQENRPDSIVDMVFVVYRNIANELPIEKKKDIEAKFGLTPGGEASLGYGKTFTVDGGLRKVNMSYPGSGVTVKIAYGGVPISGCAHELAHHLTGGGEMHFNKGMWGLLSSWGYTQRSFMMNSWERWKAGWLEFKDIGPQKGTYEVELKDYLHDNEAIRIFSPYSKEYFILENHQRINKFWDVPDQSTDEAKGVYVLRQSGSVGNSVSLICADGRWKWTVVSLVKNPYGGDDSLPVFQKIAEDKISGYMDNEMIPYNLNGKSKTDVIHFYKDESGKIIENAVFRGDGKDYFDVSRNEFYSDTNPNSELSTKKPSGISFKILSKKSAGDDGDVYHILIKIE